MIRLSFVFKENHVFTEEEDNLSDKIVIVEEELDGIIIDVNGIGNLMDLPRLMFIDEECGNLKLVLDGGELARSISRRKKSDVLQAHRSPLCDKW